MNIDYRHLKIKSSPCQISRLDSYVKQIMNACDLKNDMYSNILISLTEAVNNAIIHGNKKDVSKYVSIVCKSKNEALVIQVIDEGKGFNPTKIKSPLAPERIEKCGGRGVMIMNELCDRVTYQNNGSTVEIHFKIK